MDVNTKYYIGDGKKLFQIQKLIDKSDLSKEEKEMIIDEYNKLSLASQGMRHQLNRVIENVNNIIKQPF